MTHQVRYLGSVPDSAGPPSLPSAQSSAWKSRGLCAQSDPDAWYPESDGDRLIGSNYTRPGDHEGKPISAKAVCRRCPVRTVCLQTALDNREPYGIWGGLTVKERNDLRKKMAS